MAKRRTKNQKTKARQNLQALYKNARTAREPNFVKGEFTTKAKAEIYEARKSKKPFDMVKDIDVLAVKRDIVKSIALAVFIFCIELMLYLAWK